MNGTTTHASFIDRTPAGGRKFKRRRIFRALRVWRVELFLVKPRIHRRVGQADQHRTTITLYKPDNMQTATYETTDTCCTTL